jgi:RND family efflux transporter MFP subunit
MPFVMRSFLLVGMLGLAACSPPPANQEPVRSVKVIQVGESAMSNQTEYAGEVKARVESRLGFRVGGKLVARHVDLGQRVKAGQLLAEIDAQDYRLTADAARAQVNAAITNRDLAAADFKRFKELRDKEFISSAELERRESALKAAQAQVDQAQAQFSAQTNQVGYSKLLADKSGVITGIDAEAGQVVSPGMPVVRLAQDGPRDVMFAVPEDKVASLQRGQNVQVKFWGSDETHQASVYEIAASADPVTRTFGVRVALTAQVTAPLGSTVSVNLGNSPTANIQRIKLPTSALRQEGGKTMVWVLDMSTMTVKSQEIQVTTADGNEAVVNSGLQAGQQVVVAGVHVLSPGQKVTLFQPVGTKP